MIKIVLVSEGQKWTNLNKSVVRCEYIYPNGDQFQGWLRPGITDYCDEISNQDQWEGKYIYANGSYYNGSWRDGVRHGRGEMCYHDGNIYKGNFVGGVLEGQGSCRYQTGPIMKVIGIRGKDGVTVRIQQDGAQVMGSGLLIRNDQIMIQYQSFDDSISVFR